MGRELLAYTKFMITLRKAHGILHSKTLLRGIDTLSCGFPDISFHGREAWRPDTSPASRCMGIMYCGFYAAEGEREDECFFYIAVNMHWEVNYLGLPKLPKGKIWIYRASIVLCTTGNVPAGAQKPLRKKRQNKGNQGKGDEKNR